MTAIKLSVSVPDSLWEQARLVAGAKVGQSQVVRQALEQFVSAAPRPILVPPGHSTDIAAAIERVLIHGRKEHAEGFAVALERLRTTPNPLGLLREASEYDFEADLLVEAAGTARREGHEVPPWYDEVTTDLGDLNATLEFQIGYDDGLRHVWAEYQQRLALPDVRMGDLNAGMTP